MNLVFHDASFPGDINDIHEKLQYLVEYFCAGNKASFSREAGIPTPVTASITGGRKSKPSFEVLQKILIRFPVNANWLVLGQGQILREEQLPTPVEASTPQYDTRAHLQAIDDELTKQRGFFEAYKHDLSEKTQLEQVYRIGDVHPASKTLADRLSVTSEEARDFVLSGRIRSTYVGKNDDRARRNGVSYLISEAAVREFLGDSTAIQLV